MTMIDDDRSPSSTPDGLSHKQLKALAKASRPWYRKKRFWALGLVAVIGIGAAAGGSGGSDGADADNNGGVKTLSANGDNPPQADVELTACSNGEFGIPEIMTKITNHSSKRSDYSFQVNVLDASGTKIGEGFGASNNVEAGQSAIEEVFATANGDVASCTITEVNRFASS